jgi:hypothetical protein
MWATPHIPNMGHECYKLSPLKPLTFLSGPRLVVLQYHMAQRY